MRQFETNCYFYLTSLLICMCWLPSERRVVPSSLYPPATHSQRLSMVRCTTHTAIGISVTYIEDGCVVWPGTKMCEICFSSAGYGEKRPFAARKDLGYITHIRYSFGIHYTCQIFISDSLCYYMRECMTARQRFKIIRPRYTHNTERKYFWPLTHRGVFGGRTATFVM